MKQVLKYLVIVLIVVIFTTKIMAQSTSAERTITVTPPKVFSFDPINIDGRLYLPIEDICPDLGITMEYKDGLVKLSKDGTKLTFIPWTKKVFRGHSGPDKPEELELSYQSFVVYATAPTKPLPGGVKTKNRKDKKPELISLTMVPIRLVTDTFGAEFRLDGKIFIIGNMMFEMRDDHRVLTLINQHENWWIEGAKIVKKTKISPASTGINVLFGEPIPVRRFVDKDGKKQTEEIVCNILGHFLVENISDFDEDRVSKQFNGAPMNWSIHVIFGRYFHACTKRQIKRMGYDDSHGCIRQLPDDAKSFFAWAYDYVVVHKKTLDVFITGIPTKTL